MSSALLEKLKLLVGANIDAIFENGHCHIVVSGTPTLHLHTLLRIENEDCLVLQQAHLGKAIVHVPIDKIASITTY
ncbi:MAG: hypothetical protein IPP31_10420 [Chitinophagaceae bacterium]|nr:hypothetical protein [Chitinophagaceae bacterium]